MQRAVLLHGRVVAPCVAGACLLAAACSLIIDTNANQCARDEDCSSFHGAPMCVAGLCVAAEAAAQQDTGGAADALALDGGQDAGMLVDAEAGDDADGAPVPTVDAPTANAWADEAVAQLMLNFWRPTLLGGGYLSSTPMSASPTSYWTFAQAWEAVLDAAVRHKGARFKGTLRTLYLAQDAVGWGSPSYADENWMTLPLQRSFDLTQDTLYQRQADLLYGGIMNAWDSTCCLMPAGGIWSDRAHTMKSTAVNAGAVLSGARFYQDEGNIEFLLYAQQVYDYWSANMVDAATGQVSDQVAPGAQKSAATFTYDEGLMIGAGIALAQAADAGVEPASLVHTNARFMVSRETAPSRFGQVLSDGSCTGDCGQYKGIAARYLGQLYQASSMAHPEYLSLLVASALGAHELARDPASGAYAADWSVPFALQTTPFLLSATSSAASLFSAVASSLGAPPGDPPGTYQAEEAVLHGVGVEAKHPGFEGWGYVTGWDQQGQVDFLVTVPADGKYDLTFRYATGGATAVRLITVNGTSIPSLMFPDTGDWSRYGMQSVTVSLVAGDSTITLASNVVAGTMNPLNLDLLSVALVP
jgi:hypothetical protein